MSASSKPPRRTWNAKAPTTEQVARALLDAQVFGDKAAACRHNVHANTIKNWRRDWGTSATVIAEMDRLRVSVRQGWIDEARDARRMLVARTVQLAMRSKSLRAVTEASRRMHEIVMSHEIVNDDPSTAADALAERHEPDQSAHPGEAEGSIGSEGDDGPDDLGGGEG